MFRSIQINSKNEFLNVFIKGNPADPAILLLHGFPEDAESFESLITELVQNKYYVVAPNQRGYFGSVKSEAIKDYSIKNITEDIHALILALELNHISIIGHDWGGVITWNLITEFPNYFNKAMIVSAPHPNVMRENLLFNPIQIMKSWYIFFFQLKYFPEKFLGINKFKYFGKDLISKTYHHKYNQKNLKRILKQINEENNFKFMLNWYRAMKYFRPISKSDKASVHVNLIWGEKDPYLSQALAKQSIEVYSAADLKVLPNVSHWPHHEIPEEFNALIIDLLK